MRRVIGIANVRRVIGFAIVAVGIWFTFLNVSADISGCNVSSGIGYRAACDSVWRAMLSSANNTDHECDVAALPHLWIAGGVAAVGIGVAFWGTGRRRLLAMVGLVLLLTLLITIGGWMQSYQPRGGSE